MKNAGIIFIALIFSIGAFAQNRFNGLDMSLGNLYRLSDAKTRSISPENFTGEKGKGGMAKPEDGDIPNVANAARAARDLGQGWKVNPYIHIQSGETITIADIEGPGNIQHMWMTPTGNWRFSIIRIYWDDETEPSVEVPLGDFFGMGWNEYAPLNSLPVSVNPGSAFNCFWPMPFRKRARVTIENINDEKPMTLYYQITYSLTDVPDDAAYFHAQWRRTNPNLNSLYTIVDNIKGKGHYVGTYMAWGVTNTGWWGEGEIKFFMDGDDEFPTICGTGAEDYFLGSYGFVNRENREYEVFTTPYAGMHQVITPDGVYNSQQRFGLYRWHIMDPIRFEEDLKVTIQDLGWRHGGRYLPQKSDLASVAFWYQREPHNTFPSFPSWKELEVR